jgi:hypothetical protein
VQLVKRGQEDAPRLSQPPAGVHLPTCSFWRPLLSRIPGQDSLFALPRPDVARIVQMHQRTFLSLRAGQGSDRAAVSADAGIVAEWENEHLSAFRQHKIEYNQSLIAGSNPAAPTTCREPR